MMGKAAFFIKKKLVQVANYIWNVSSIIQEDLQKILNQKNCNSWGRHK